MVRQLLFLSLFTSNFIFAQTTVEPSSKIDSLKSNTSDSALTIVSDSRIEKLLEMKKNNALHSPSLEGFRIQLFYGPRSEALKHQAEFLKLYPEISCYLIYEAPYFKVRVGDYRNKYEARRVHIDLTESFPDSFILEDKINLPELAE